MGNGHDTLFLARLVGTPGKVIGFDVQPEALAHTRRRLRAVAASERVELVLDSHENMGVHLREQSPRAVMFNLGYLPGSDKRLVTLPRSTAAALRQALSGIAPGGIVSTLVYRGHRGGLEEAEQVGAVLAEISPALYRVHQHPASAQATSPLLYLIYKRDGA